MGWRFTGELGSAALGEECARQSVIKLVSSWDRSQDGLLHHERTHVGYKARPLAVVLYCFMVVQSFLPSLFL